MALGSRLGSFQIASHGGGGYMIEQSVGDGNYPGAVIYERRDGRIFRRGTHNVLDPYRSLLAGLALSSPWLAAIIPIGPRNITIGGDPEKLGWTVEKNIVD